MRRKNRLVIDTNLWISWLIGKKQTHLNKVLSDQTVQIFSSQEQILELFEVIDRSKFNKLIPKEIADEFKLFFLEAVTIVKVKIKVQLSRDPNDDFLLALSKTAKAQYLLTGDKDLLALRKYAGTYIVKINQYLSA
ncbi:MAG: putative toxin-antitoxin system toxin component, PIN family [Bacteroidota bacterium]